MVYERGLTQDTPPRVDGAGVLTGPLQLGELVPHRVNQPTGVGVSASQARVRVDRCGVASTLGLGVVDAVGSLPCSVSVVGVSNRPVS
jgi:hypothetical protein